MESNKITEMSVLELKAAAYDTLAGIEAGQMQLRAINQELDSRIRGDKAVEPVPPTE